MTAVLTPGVGLTLLKRKKWGSVYDCRLKTETQRGAKIGGWRVAPAAHRISRGL